MSLKNGRICENELLTKVTLKMRWGSGRNETSQTGGFDQSCGEVPWAGPELPDHTSGFVLADLCFYVLQTRKQSMWFCSLLLQFYNRPFVPDMSNLPLFRDPWARREAWRKHSVFSNRAMFRNLFPGFGIAVVAFTAYVVADNIYISQIDQPAHH